MQTSVGLRPREVGHEKRGDNRRCRVWKLQSKHAAVDVSTAKGEISCVKAANARSPPAIDGKVSMIGIDNAAE